MLDIKIYVSCHNDFYVPKCKYLYPIQVGTYFADKKIPNFIHDDEGINISYKNKSYCELTALYWAWKNDNADYYGLFHYRRYLSFNPEHEKSNTYYKTYDFIDDTAVNELHLNEKDIEDIVKDYDVIAPIANNIEVNFKNNYEQYCNSQYLNQKDLDIFIEVIKEKYPHLSRFVDAYMNSHFAYFCNIGIMKKQYFHEYCEILFDVLEETERRCDVSKYSVNELRVFGHLSERLFGIMYNYWNSLGTVKMKKLRMANFKNFDYPILEPVFLENNIVIVLASNNYYSYYLGVTIQSIIENADNSYNYDIIVLDGGILQENIEKIREQIDGKENFSIRFYNTKMLPGKEHLKSKQHMSVETWYRIYLPYILKGYSKVLYLDCDLVVNSSLVDLFDVDLSNHLVAATRDLPLVGLYCDNHFVEYMNNVLNLENPCNYLQAGVLLLNLEMFRTSYTLEQLLELALSYDWRWLDQDVMNVVANRSLYILEQKWNVEVNRKGIRINQIKFCPANMYFEYMEARKSPAIIHYSGEQKPWANPNMDMASYFWKYAKASKFYELILFRIIDVKDKTVQNFCNDKISSLPTPKVSIVSEEKKELQTIVEAKLDPQYKLQGVFPMGSKRRLALRRFLHLFRSDIYPTAEGFWTIESDIHMHNKILINNVKKYLGLSFFDESMKKMHKVKNRHKGERCFITCTGPSLQIEDLEKLKGEYTIGVNSIVRAYEKTTWRPTYYCLVDVYAFGEYLANTPVPGNYLSINEAFLHYRTKLLNPTGNELYVPINFINHTEEYMKKNKMKYSKDPSVCIYDCFTVTNMAIQMAIYMGFKEIYLLGADCSYDPKKMHFIETKGIDDKQRNAKYLPSAVQMSIKGYEHAKRFAEKNNVKIYNATRGGMLEVFERVDFDSIELKQV